MKFEQIVSRGYIQLILVILMIPGFALASTFVEVGLRNPDDLNLLLEQGFDVTHVSHGSTADVLLYDDVDRQRLNETGLRFRVTQEDVEQFFAQRIAAGRRDDMGGYYTLEEIEDFIFTLHDDYPEVVSQPVSIGESIEGRNIWAVLISDNPEEDENEPQVLLTSLIHAREAITPHVTTTIMEMLAEGYGEDDYLTYLVDERQTWFIPCCNPDGYAYNEEIEPNGGGMWRKNRRNNGDGTYGVDLNRNWGGHWGYDDRGSDPRPRDPTYRGPRAFSEPETQALREFVNDFNFKISLFFHSYSNLCLYPFGYDYVHAEHRPVLRALSEKFTEVNNYLPGTGWEILYVTNGDSDDWLYDSDEHNPIMAFTPEVGSRQDNFWPPLNRKQPLIDENIDACLKAIDYGDNPRRALLPDPPTSVSYFINEDGYPHLSWNEADDDENPAVGYQAIAIDQGEAYTDEVENNNPDWDLFEVTVTGFQPRSQPRCYRFDIESPLAKLTLDREIIAPERFTAWLRMDLSSNNNLALEVTEDGYTWIAVEGRQTQNIIEEEYNHGPGLKRIDTDGEWEEFWWDLSEFEGRQIKLRFRYYEFGYSPRNDFLYIDDIGPLPGIEGFELVEVPNDDHEYLFEEIDHHENMAYFVRSIDREDDIGFWSLPAVEIEQLDEFTLDLHEGWQMISAPVDPNDEGLELLFANALHENILRIMKDGAGRFWAPDFNFNQLGDWDPLKGYWLKLDDDISIDLVGLYVPLDTPILLREGWNLISYLPTEEMDAEDAFETVVDNLLMVKDDQGHFWTLEHNFSNLDDMRQGEGYQLKVTEDDELIYPEPNRQLANTVERSQSIFKPIGTDNHSVLLVFSNNLPQGEIIAVDDDGNISGAQQISGEQTRIGLAVWGEAEAGTEGYGDQEQFKIYHRESAASLGTELTFNVLAGDGNWEKDGLSVLAVTGIERHIPETSELLNAYPNPFNSTVEINFALHRQSDVNIDIYDAAGRLVDQAVNGRLNAGIHAVNWEGKNQPTGIYFARLSFDNKQSSVHNRMLKLLLVR